MRPLWIVAAIVCGVLALATVASASVRDEIGSVVASMGAVSRASAPPASHPRSFASVPASPSPASAETSVAAEAGEGAPATGTHGAVVSKVARDKDATATKTLGNGKTVTNHGMAVSAVARSQGRTGDH